MSSITISSWNVNGIRACYNKGTFFDYLDQKDPDILFLQETKAHVSDIPPELDNPKGYYTEWFSAEKKGYSSVAIFTKIKPLHIFKGFGVDRFDAEGRVIGAEFDDFIAFGVYFPNGQMSDERLQYKLDFFDAFFTFTNDLVASGKNIIILGDYNIAHKAIDLARPKQNETVSGFLPVERAWMDKIIDDFSYVDTFRQFNQNPEEYSWWNYRTRARSRNVGWRIDYTFVNKALADRVRDAFIQQDVLGSDHCPVGIKLAYGA